MGATARPRTVGVCNASEQALEDLARKVSEMFAVTCRFLREGEAEGVFSDNTAATHLYRVAEAISNAIRHGKATRVELKLQSSGRSVALTVADDGKGFPKRMK